MKYPLLTLLAACMLMTASAAAAQEESKKVDASALIEKVKAGMVIVERTLKYDQGEAPNTGEGYYNTEEEYIQEERPKRTGGYLIAPDLVVTLDFGMHGRFIEKCEVRFGNEVVPAKVAGYGIDHAAVFLQLEKPLAGAKPLKFASHSKGPIYTLSYDEADGDFLYSFDALSSASTFSSDGGFLNLSGDFLAINAQGEPVGMVMGNRMAADGSWKGSPAEWKRVSAEEHAQLLSSTQKQVDQSILRVTINFRSPKNQEQGFSPYERGSAATELYVKGIQYDEAGHVLVLTTLPAKTTARIERIRVFDAQGNVQSAQFVGTLKDYGALVVKLDEPFGKPVQLIDDNIRQYRTQLLASSQIRQAGEQRVVYNWHARISHFYYGWQQNVYPVMDSGDGSFVFDREGRLVVLPLVRRSKVPTDDGYSGNREMMTSAAQIGAVLTNPAEHFDAANVPLSEAEESRLAWMGIVLQPMDADLARMNEVVEETQDGEFGGLVTYVYPDSPAAKAGVEPGAILLRLHVEGYPKPIDLQMDEDYAGFEGGFPWDRLDEVPEQYFDRIPRPWPSAETTLTRTLTDIGFGKEFKADFIIDGKQTQLPFIVEQGPDHYDSAAKYKSDQIGITVRNLTFEVQRYLQKTAEDPGVVISRIEPGSRASIAGLKPYELITHINQQPVRNAEEFEEVLKQAESGQLNLSISRMTRTRQVRVRWDAADAPVQPSDEGETAGEEIDEAADRVEEAVRNVADDLEDAVEE